MPNHPHRRAYNIAVVVGGLLGLTLQSITGWDILTTFVLTLALCGVCIGVTALI